MEGVGIMYISELALSDLHISPYSTILNAEYNNRPSSILCRFDVVSNKEYKTTGVVRKYKILIMSCL
jgi:hypothetical protein